MKRFFSKYATFSGRASRSEYWWVALFIFLVTLIPGILYTIGFVSSVIWAQQNSTTVYGTDVSPGLVNAPGWALIVIGGILGFLIWAAFLVPTLAISWRRLHDADLSGGFWFLSFIPSVGPLIVFILTLLPSKPTGVRFDAR